jgi:transcriptional regulator with XRE-family HTH domain
MGRRREPQPALGLAIRRLLDQRDDLTQRALARAADVDEAHLSHIVNGNANPAWGTVRRLSATLGVSVSELAALAEQLERDAESGRSGS